MEERSSTALLNFLVEKTLAGGEGGETHEGRRSLQDNSSESFYGGSLGLSQKSHKALNGLVGFLMESLRKKVAQGSLVPPLNNQGETLGFKTLGCYQGSEGSSARDFQSGPDHENSSHNPEGGWILSNNKSLPIFTCLTIKEKESSLSFSLSN